MNANKTMEMYNSIFQPVLAEGVYTVKMTKYEYVANEKLPYIKFEFEVLETGRKLIENRFEKGFSVFLSQLRQQLGRENEAIKPQEFFNELINEETPFNIWVVRKIVNGIPRTNFNFLEPILDEGVNPVVMTNTLDCK